MQLYQFLCTTDNVPRFCDGHSLTSDPMNERNLIAFRLVLSALVVLGETQTKHRVFYALEKACYLLRLVTGLLTLICKTNNTGNTSQKFNRVKQTHIRVCVCVSLFVSSQQMIRLTFPRKKNMKTYCYPQSSFATKKQSLLRTSI